MSVTHMCTTCEVRMKSIEPAYKDEYCWCEVCSEVTYFRLMDENT